MIHVKLTYEELMIGAVGGCNRRINRIREKSKSAHGIPDRLAWGADVLGAIGEVAAAKAFGVYWTGSTGIGARDIVGYEVRTRAEHTYDLTLYKNDDDNAQYLLVTGCAQDYVLRGWMLGKEGKQEKYWKQNPATKRWAYFIPQSHLRDI